MRYVLLPVLGVLAVSTRAGADVITFEELGARPQSFAQTTPLSGEYPQVFFTGPGEGDGGAILNGNAGFGILPRSGDHFLAFNEESVIPMQNGGFPRGPETLIFTELMSHVEIYAAGGGGDVGATFFMQAFDDNGDVVGVSTVSAQGTWGLLSVDSPLGIRVVRLTQIGSDPHYVYDDLGFTAVPGPGALGLALITLAGATRRRRSP